MNAWDFKSLLFNRCSCRTFNGQFISLDVLANILFAGYGMKRLVVNGHTEVLERTIPSAGGMYPLELYVINIRVEQLETGIYHYLSYPTLLEQLKILPLPIEILRSIFFQGEYLENIAAIIIATSIVEKTMKKYFDRGYRYILYEAGHCFQNMNLMATANKIASLNIGGFLDQELAELLEIDMEIEVPLYAMALGMH